MDKNEEERTYADKGALYGVAAGSIIGAVITRFTGTVFLPIGISLGLILGRVIGFKIKKDAGYTCGHK